MGFIFSLAGSRASPDLNSVLHNDEHTSVNPPEDGGCTISQGLQKQEMDKVFLNFNSLILGYKKE